MGTGAQSPGRAPRPGSLDLPAELGRDSIGTKRSVQVVSVLARLAVVTLAVHLCNWLLPGFHADVPGGPIIFGLVLGVVALIMQPVMVGGAVLLGWGGVLLLAFVGQAAVVLVAAQLLPRVHVDGFVDALLVALILG